MCDLRPSFLQASIHAFAAEDLPAPLLAADAAIGPPVLDERPAARPRLGRAVDIALAVRAVADQEEVRHLVPLTTRPSRLAGAGVGIGSRHTRERLRDTTA